MYQSARTDYRSAHTRSPVRANRASVVGLYLVSFALLMASLYFVVVPRYGYSGFEWSPDPLKLLEGIVLTCGLAAVVPPVSRKPSDLLMHLLLLVPVLPMLALYSAADLSRSFVYMCAVAFVLVLYVREVRVFKYQSLKSLTPQRVMYVLLALASLIIAAIVGLGGLSYWNLDLLNVYEYRAASASNLPSIFGYISPIASKVVLPTAVLLAVMYRNLPALALAVFLCLVLFGLTGHKGTLVYPILTVGIYRLMAFGSPLRTMVYAYCAVVFLAIALFFVFGGNTLLDNLIVRRGIFVPALINFWYHEVFAGNSFVFWASSKITFGLLEYPYPLPVPRLIGLVKYDIDTINLNTGWLGSGYMNAGVGGMVLYAVIIGLLLRYLDAVARSLGLPFVAATAVVPMITLFTSSDLPTSMLNHGILVLLVLYSVCDFGTRPVSQPTSPGRTRRASSRAPSSRPSGAARPRSPRHT